MTGHSRRWMPAAVVVLAVAAMAAASRYDGPLEPGMGSGPWEGARPAVALAAVIILVVIATNFNKHRDDGYGVLRRAGTAAAVLLTATAVLTPIGLLYFGRKPQPPPPEQVTPDQGQSPRFFPTRTVKWPTPQHRHSGRPIAEWVAQGGLYVILAAAFALILYVLVRLLSRRWFSRQPVPLADFEPLDPALEQLAEAVAAGTEALEYEGDAREAVIACYSAMELAVSAGGGWLRATDTPEEFLRRVTAANLMPEEPARRLTDLFH